MHQTRRETVAAVAGAIGLALAGCTSQDGASGEGTLAIESGLDGTIGEIETDTGTIEDIPVDLSELRVAWAGVEDDVESLLIAVETDYGRLLEEAIERNWARDDEFEADDWSYSLFQSTDAEPDDFRLEEPGTEETFEVRFQVLVELLDESGEVVLDGSDEDFGEVLVRYVEEEDEEESPEEDDEEEEEEEEEESSTPTLTVTVTEEGGGPIAGATVRVLDEEGVFGSIFPDTAFEDTTDSEGRVTTTIDDGTYTVEVEHGAYENASTEVTIDGSDEAVSIALTPIDGGDSEDDDEESDDPPSDDDDAPPEDGGDGDDGGEAGDGDGGDDDSSPGGDDEEGGDDNSEDGSDDSSSGGDNEDGDDDDGEDGENDSPADGDDDGDSQGDGEDGDSDETDGNDSTSDGGNESDEGNTLFSFG